MAKAPAKSKTASKVEPAAVIQSIKGFNQDLTCRGFQFAPGQTYTIDGDIKACQHGFHACTVEAHPLSVFQHYAPAGSRFFEVTQGGDTNSDDGIKIASATITIGIELSIGDLVKRAWDYVWSRAVKSDDAHVNIEAGAASATGYQGAASATGTRGAAISSYVGKVMGADGNALFGIERDDNLDIVSVAAGIVGRDGIQANVWYVCRNGKLVAA